MNTITPSTSAASPENVSSVNDNVKPITTVSKLRLRKKKIPIDIYGVTKSSIGSSSSTAIDRHITVPVNNISSTVTAGSNSIKRQKRQKGKHTGEPSNIEASTDADSDKRVEGATKRVTRSASRKVSTETDHPVLNTADIHTQIGLGYYYRVRKRKK